jgi:hypothetical protein
MPTARVGRKDLNKLDVTGNRAKRYRPFSYEFAISPVAISNVYRTALENPVKKIAKPY